MPHPGRSRARNTTVQDKVNPPPHPGLQRSSMAVETERLDQATEGSCELGNWAAPDSSQTPLPEDAADRWLPALR